MGKTIESFIYELNITSIMSFLSAIILTAQYLFIIIGLVALIAWIIYEYQEHRIRLRCSEQNLRYVRVPSQMLTLLFGKRYDYIENKIMDQYGPVYGCHMANKLTITISNPELAQIICNREFTKFPNRRQITTPDIIFDNMLFSTQDEQWKRIRAILSPTFSTGKLKQIKFIIDDTVKNMVKHFDEEIKHHSLVNVKKVIGAFTMDTIIQMGYGVKVDTIHQPDNPFLLNARRIFSKDLKLQNILLIGFGAVCPQILKLFNIKFEPEALGFFKKCSIEIIQKKRQELKTRPEHKATNFIELILEAEQEQQEKEKHEFIQQKNGSIDLVFHKPFKYISNDEVIAQCVMFFMVGYDTTAGTLTNTCYQLAKHQDKQEKLYQDIIKTLKVLENESQSKITDPHELITFDTLNRFEYMNAVLDETMRLITIATATERMATEDIHLETADKKIQFDVKKGDMIRIGFSKLHWDPDNFSNPQQFIPERFLPNSPEPVFNKHAFMPFGSGPRGCLAKHLALLETKMALVHLFRQFRLRLDPSKKDLEFYVNFDFAVTKDTFLHVERR